MINLIHFEKPILIMFVGSAGSGKTTLAKEICKKIVNSSFMSKDMFQSAFTKERNDETYEYISEPTLKFLLSYSNNQLKLKKIPIIDAPYSINNWRGGRYKDFASFYKKIAEQNDTVLIIFRCKTSTLEELKLRLKKRNYLRDKWKLKNWSKFLEREPMDFEINHKYVFDIITNKPIDTCIEEILGHVNSLINLK